RDILVIVGVALAHVGAGDMHVGAHRLEMQDLLGGHLVRYHQHHPIALGAADQRQAEAGVSRGRLDDGSAGAQTAVALGGIDHGKADAILYRAAGVLRFQLEKEGARAGVQAADAHQRRIADQFKHGRARIVRHVVTSLRQFALDERVAWPSQDIPRLEHSRDCTTRNPDAVFDAMARVADSRANAAAAARNAAATVCSFEQVEPCPCTTPGPSASPNSERTPSKPSVMARWPCWSTVAWLPTWSRPAPSRRWSSACTGWNRLTAPGPAAAISPSGSAWKSCSGARHGLPRAGLARSSWPARFPRCAMPITDALLDSFRNARHVVVFTGAGVSAESGIPTFRDALAGLWERFDPADLATPDAFRRDPALVWGWYEWRRMKVLQAQPNPAHLAIATLAERVPTLTLVTQNVDALHERAGSRDVIHLHGSLHAPRCFACARPHTLTETPEEPAEGRR